MHVVWL